VVSKRMQDRHHQTCLVILFWWDAIEVALRHAAPAISPQDEPERPKHFSSEKEPGGALGTLIAYL
jgi:hypothetical protein